VRFALQYQDDRGAFVDPILGREFQYATPYLAYAIAALVNAGRGDDLLVDGVRAMNHATELVAEGNASIPDQHGEFFIAPLADAIDMLAPRVDEVLVDRWRQRMRTGIDSIIENRRLWSVGVSACGRASIPSSRIARRRQTTGGPMP
jgi:hypothetical protein